MDTIVNDLLQKQSIFRVGEVLSVNGREVCIKVDKNKIYPTFYIKVR